MSTQFDTDVLVKERVEFKEPSMYKVIFHNDNRTTVEFVIMALMEIFYKTPEEAEQITLKIHHEGSGVAGIYAQEVAEMKCETTLSLARSQGYPLQVEVEEE